MTVFLLCAAALAAIAVAWLLRPARARGGRRVSASEANVSIYRDQLRELDGDLAAGKIAVEDHERARREIEARLLADVPVAEPVEVKPARRPIAWIAGIAVPILAVATYLVVGSPGMVGREAAHPQVTPQQIEAMVARLAARLRENPDDVDGWKMLGRSYGALGRFDEAAGAYAQAAVKAPGDAQLLVDFADVLAMARGQSMQGEPEQLVRRALELDPKNLKGLALAGTAAFERKDFQRAADTWQRMLALVPPGGEDARAIQSNIDEAIALKSSKVLRGEVRLSEKLKKQVSPDDTVFVFARAADGPPMPLAAMKKQVRDLPFRFALDDSLAMMPQAKLSAFPRVIVSARVAKAGTPAPQPGDLEGSSGTVAHDASGVRVVIDSVVR